MPDLIKIKAVDDWKAKRHDPRLACVVDPLVLRIADVFLGGISGTAGPQDRELCWAAIKDNLTTLCTFFDTLILEEFIPAYDYNYTFSPGEVQEASSLIKLCAKHGDALVDVRVYYDAYEHVRAIAKTQLDALDPVDAALEESIVDEMSTFDWEWRADVALTGRELQPRILKNDREVAIETFRFAVLLFGGYAQLLCADHVLQPNRSWPLAKSQ